MSLGSAESLEGEWNLFPFPAIENDWSWETFSDIANFGGLIFLSLSPRQKAGWYASKGDRGYQWWRRICPSLKTEFLPPSHSQKWHKGGEEVGSLFYLPRHTPPQKSKCIFLSLQFVGKTARMQCFTIQIKAKNTSGCLVFLGARRRRGASFWNSCKKHFSASEKLFYSMKEKCVCWKRTWMLKTHCSYKSLTLRHSS